MKIALITGGSSGIGLRLAGMFYAEGFRVDIVSRRKITEINLRNVFPECFAETVVLTKLYRLIL